MSLKLSRRQFNLLSVSAAATSVFTSTSRLSAAGPNSTMGIAIIGLNNRGMDHVKGFAKNKNVEIRAVVDIDESVGEKKAGLIADLTGKRPTVYRDMRQAFDSKDIDLVSCATPNHWHALCGVWAMQAGKDIYLEKPISHNIHEGRTLIAAAKKYGKILQTGTQTRSSTACIEAMKFIQDGKIGDVKFARGLCYKRRKSIGPLGDYPVPASVDFNLWSGPATFTNPQVTREKFHYDWHWQRHYGNGDLGNQGPHQTDVARWGLGLDRHPNSVISYGGRLGYQAERKDPKYIDAGDTANTEVSIYDYGDKCIVFETRGLDPSNSGDGQLGKLYSGKEGNKIGVVFYGSKGLLVQYSYAHFAAFDLELKLIQEFKTKDDLNAVHMGNFVDACLSREAKGLNADAMTGHLSAAVSHLGNISYYLGETNRVTPSDLAKSLSGIKSLDDNGETLKRTLDHLNANGVDIDAAVISLGPQLAFDPNSERFTNNDAANKMLSREYRKGFEVPDAKSL
ncbi:MAG: Gfo/Idh/MocA family oxidoreductase [Pirellulaceae bacterium]|nr:Gfo/Idh/MocA family oxidoreductase [Pirellulaceae bacterium]